MKRTIKMFSSQKRRDDLWYDFARVWTEHRYADELEQLGKLIDEEKYREARIFLEKLRKIEDYYLSPELIRAETLISFIYEDLAER